MSGLKQQVTERIRQAGTDPTNGQKGRLLSYLRDVPENDPRFEESVSLDIQDLIGYWDEEREKTRRQPVTAEGPSGATAASAQAGGSLPAAAGARAGGAVGPVAAAGAGPGPGGAGAAGAPGTELAAKVDELSLKVEMLKQYLAPVVRNSLTWRDGSISGMSSTEKDSKRKDLREKLQQAGITKCQILGEDIPDIPHKLLSAAHLCKLSWANGDLHTVLGLARDEVFSVRNGLLLCKPIERAFDNSAVCFYMDYEDENKLKLHIIWDAIKKQPLCDSKWTNRIDQAALQTAIGSLTYGDLEGKPLLYCDKVSPFLRVLNTHAQLALRHAKEHMHTALDWPCKDYGSHDNVSRWLQQQEVDGQGPSESQGSVSEQQSLSSAP